MVLQTTGGSTLGSDLTANAIEPVIDFFEMNFREAFPGGARNSDNTRKLQVQTVRKRIQAHGAPIVHHIRYVFARMIWRSQPLDAYGQVLIKGMITTRCEGHLLGLVQSQLDHGAIPRGIRLDLSLSSQDPLQCRWNAGSNPAWGTQSRDRLAMAHSAPTMSKTR